MLGSIARSITAVVVGLVAALLVVVGVEGMSTLLHPFPLGVDPTDMEVCKAHVARCPSHVLALGVVGWSLAVFAAAWLGTRLGTRRHIAHGLVIGALLLAAAVMNLLMLPYPIWFEALVVVLLPASAFLGARLGRGRAASAPS